MQLLIKMIINEKFIMSIFAVEIEWFAPKKTINIRCTI